MLNAESALQISDRDNARRINDDIPAKVEEFFDAKVRTAADWGKHHFVLSEKDIRILRDELLCDVGTWGAWLHSLGYKVSSGMFDNTATVRWN